MKYSRSITGFLALVFIVSMLGCTGLSTKDEGAPVPSSSEEPAITPTVEQTLDADGDGVADADDLCPETPAGTTVDTGGCPVAVEEEGPATGGEAGGIVGMTARMPTHTLSVMSFPSPWRGTKTYGNRELVERSAGIAISPRGIVHIYGKQMPADRTHSDGLWVSFSQSGDPINEVIVRPDAYVSSMNVEITGAATDLADNVFLVGTAMGGGRISGFLIKYNNAFVKQWETTLDVHQFKGVAVDRDPSRDFVYVVGSAGLQTDPRMKEAFIAKYSMDGTYVSEKRFGTGKDDHASAVAIDAYGSAWISGSTEKFGSEGSDAFVAKFYRGNLDRDPDMVPFGNVLFDYANEIVIDSSNNIYVAGTVRRDFTVVNENVLIEKIDMGLSNIWKKEQDTGKREYYVEGLAVDRNGVYVAGSFDTDYELLRFDPATGNLAKSLRQEGTEVRSVKGIALDKLGYLHVVLDHEVRGSGGATEYDDIWLQVYDKDLILQ